MKMAFLVNGIILLGKLAVVVFSSLFFGFCFVLFFLCCFFLFFKILHLLFPLVLSVSNCDR